MKNILFFTHYFPPEVNAPANRTYEHAIRWIRAGVNVTVITNHPNHPHGKLYPGYRNRWISRENIDGMNIIRVKTYLTPNKGIVRRSLNYLVYMFMAIVVSRKVKHVDRIVATSPQFFCGIAGSIISKIRKRPLILEIRDLWPDSITAVEAVKKNVLIKLLIKVERWMYFSASKIVTLTNAFKHHIKEYGFSGEKIITITNGVDFQRIEIIEPEPLIFEKNDRFILSYVGTFGLAHKLETVLEAALLLRDNQDIHFLLIGDGADRTHLEEMISEKSIKNVTLLPLQPKKLIPYYLDLSDVGLIMLKNNRLFKTVIPSKMFEYMGFSKPIIISVPEGEATGIIEDNSCGVKVSPENPSELMNAILRFNMDRNIGKEYGERGYQAVSKNYNRDILAQKMLDIIVSDK